MIREPKLLQPFISRPVLRNLIVLLSFVLPLSLLYFLYPNSFQFVWKARGPYLIFLWLFCLELAIAWRRHKLSPSNEARTLFTLVFTAFLITYVLAISFFGLNNAVLELGKLVGVPYERFGYWLLESAWLVSFEWLIFASFFTVIILLAYGATGLRRFPVSLFFLWAITFFFMLDTMAPFGVVWVLQAFVPFTAESAAAFLEWLGNQTVMYDLTNKEMGPGTLLLIIGPSSTYPPPMFSVAVYWPSAGIHSILIYTITILLFISNASFSPLRKIVYSVVGAVGTFLANVFRIVTICIIGLKIGQDAASFFHDYVGEFFFISWILIYLLLTIYGPKLVRRLLSSKGKQPPPQKLGTPSIVRCRTALKHNDLKR